MKSVFIPLTAILFLSSLLTGCVAPASPSDVSKVASPSAAAAAPEATPTAPSMSSALPAVITLGAVCDLSGGTALYGSSIQKGIDLAVKQVNAQKVLGEGTTLKVAYEDAAGDPKLAVAAFEKLTGNPDIVAILGPTLSSEALLADPIAQAAKVPVIASSNTVAGIVEIGDYIFRTSLPESAVIPNTVKVVSSALKLKNVAILYGNDDSYTKDGFAVFKSSLTSVGIVILAEETFKKGDTNFSAQLTRIKSLNPDAIVISALAEEAAKIMIQARSLSIPANIRFIGGNGFNSPKVSEIAGPAANGAISGSAWDVGSTYPASMAFVKAFKAQYNLNPDQFAAQAFTAAWTVVIAIKDARSVDHAAVRAALAQIKEFASPLGDFSFDTYRNPAHASVVLTVQDGKFAVFKP